MLKRCQRLWAVQRDTAIFDNRTVLRPQERLHKPIAGDVPTPEDRVVDAIGLHGLASRDYVVPCLGQLFDAARAQDVHVVIANRQRDRERQAIDFIVEGRQRQHSLMIAVFLEISFLRDEGLKRLGDVFLNQRLLAVQTLHGDVGQVARDRFAQNGIGAILIGFVGGTELHFDIGMCGVEGGHHCLIGHIKKVAVGIGELDGYLVLGVNGAGRQRQNHCSGGKFHYIYSSCRG